ncbi:MAG: ABC transporter ATP-binding protein [Acidobacteria bacterium]|nr:MAG: ABC transporter ATP-binding protein [Acidobacteriota bacterium]
MADSAIVVSDLVRTFQRRGQPELRAVDGLSFAVRRGSIFGLLGPNGAGKTTTLRMLTTLLRPTSGRIAVEGFDPVEDPLEVRKRISVVIQESAADLFLSVVDNFATFGRFHGLSRQAIRDRIEDVLDQFELRQEANRKVMDLSGGYKRRVQVAKVFMIDTPVVFLDEFSTGMDPLLKRAIMGRLRQESARGRTIVLTTQILSEAEELCDDILIMRSGRQAARGDINTLKLLSGGLYEISVTFDELPDALDAAVAPYHPLRVAVTQNSALITVREHEGRVLELVAHLGRLGRVLRIEVSGASLEDIFIELTAAERQVPS